MANVKAVEKRAVAAEQRLDELWKAYLELQTDYITATERLGIYEGRYYAETGLYENVTEDILLESDCEKTDEIVIDDLTA